MPQLTLFHPEQLGSVAELAAAPLPEDVASLAGKLPRALRLGAMSWTYAGWIGVLYASGAREGQLAQRGLTAYAKHPLLRCVEIDRSFYEPLRVETYAEFAAQVPDDFRFVAKAHEDCTTVRFPNLARHGPRAGMRNPRLLDIGYTTDQVVAPFVEGLGAKAGPLIFQFSPFDVHSPERFAQRLHDFLSRLPRGPVYAVEVRNPELLTPAYGAALADAGAVHCHNVWERMPSALDQRGRLPKATRMPLVARWLRRPGDSHENAQRRFLPFNRLIEEDLERRDELASLTSMALRDEADAFVIISNHAEGCAPESIRRLAAAIAR